MTGCSVYYSVVVVFVIRLKIVFFVMCVYSTVHFKSQIVAILICLYYSNGSYYHNPSSVVVWFCCYCLCCCFVVVVSVIIIITTKTACPLWLCITSGFTTTLTHFSRLLLLFLLLLWIVVWHCYDSFHFPSCICLWYQARWTNAMLVMSTIKTFVQPLQQSHHVAKKTIKDNTNQSATTTTTRTRN